MTLPFETFLKNHPVWWSRASLTIRTTQGAPWRTPCRIFHHRRPAHWQPSSSWDQRWRWWWWWWWQWQWWWLWCSFDDLLCILVEERLPVQVDIAACQAVPPCSHLVSSPDVIPDEISDWNVSKATDHNVSTTGGTIVLPAKTSFSFTLLVTGERKNITFGGNSFSMTNSPKCVRFSAFFVVDSFQFHSRRSKKCKLQEVDLSIILDHTWQCAQQGLQLRAGLCRSDLGNGLDGTCRLIRFDHIWPASQFHFQVFAQVLLSPHPQWKSWWMRSRVVLSDINSGILSVPLNFLSLMDIYRL